VSILDFPNVLKIEDFIHSIETNLQTKMHSMEFTLPVGYAEVDFLKACARKERWAQKLLYEQFYSGMMGVCLRYSNHSEDALDIMHEGFIKVFKNIAKYQAGTSLNAWIRRIMVNTAIDYYRKQVRRRTEDLETAYDLSNNDADVISQMSQKEILACVQQLSPAYRMVFNLYVIEGYPHADIAEQLGITESTSRSNLVKARGKLKELLKSRSIGNEK